ncbi:MAG: hypothetical protein LQ337_003535 [Flavoplaca oasis]|nr:MAG: hypothetical protein LQ337_003535 [Flavoplaca oasis]
MAGNFIAEAFTLLAIGIVVIALRWVSRLMTVGFTHLAWDDYLMIVAGVSQIPTALRGGGRQTTLAYYVGARWKAFANNSMTPEARAALSPDDPEYALRVGGSKNQICGWMVYTTLLWTLKTCMLIFFSRLTIGVSNMKIRIRIGAVLLVVTYVATILAILLGCRPFHRQWQIYPDPGSESWRHRRLVHADGYRLMPPRHIRIECWDRDSAQCYDRLLFDVRAITGKCSLADLNHSWN